MWGVGLNVDTEHAMAYMWRSEVTSGVRVYHPPCLRQGLFLFTTQTLADLAFWNLYRCLTKDH